MTERARVLLLAAPTSPVRRLVARLQDPDLEVEACGSAREALERLQPALPNAVIIDGSVAGAEVFRFYRRLRSTAPGAAVPIIFTSHVRTGAEPEPTTAPDYYFGPEASLEDVEQLLFTFLPESLVEIEEGPPAPTEPAPGPGRGERPDRPAVPRIPPRASARAERPVRPTYRPERRPRRSVGELAARLQRGPSALALAYLAAYGVAEVLAAALDGRVGLVVHAGVLLAVFLHGANVPAGPERTFFWTIWLAPLIRIYGLAQPYAGASPLVWWALTAVPILVAAAVALRLVGLTAREAGLVPSARELPAATFMVPVGLALGVGAYLLLGPRPLAAEAGAGGALLAAMIVVLNPGIVEEVAFRGVLQRGVLGAHGTGLGLIYAALLYAPVAPTGLFTGSGWAVVGLTFVSGLLLAALTARTGSILGAAVLHASLALGLYMLGPLLVPASLGVAPGPATPVAGEVRTPTPRPVLTASPAPPIVVTPIGQPAAGGPTGVGQPGQAGQPPAGASTPIVLAPPLAPAPSPAASPTAQPPRAAVPTDQVVVVRGTGGAGARLRAQPGNAGQIVTVVPEYTPLWVIGEDRQADGLTWRHVRTRDGTEGWVAASFLASGP